MKSRRFLHCLPLAAAILTAAGAYAQKPSKDGPADADELTQYLKTDDGVYGAVIRDSSGAEIRREKYIRDSKGGIEEIVLTLPDGTVFLLGTSGDKRWMANPDGTGLYRTYNPDGTLRSLEERKGELLELRETYRYTGNPPGLVSVLRERPAGKTRQELFYGEGGLLEREESAGPDGAAKTLWYSYDESKRLREMRTRTGRAETRTTFRYDTDGTETEERFDVTGALVYRKTTRSDTTAIEEYFDSGYLFARLQYANGRKVKEEILGTGRIAPEGSTP